MGDQEDYQNNEYQLIYPFSDNEDFFNELNKELIQINPRAYSFIEALIEKYPNLLNYEILIFNANPKILSLIDLNNLSDDLFSILISNPNAIDLVRENIDKINQDELWDELARNRNAIDLISENINKLSEEGWNNLVKNSEAIDLIKENINKLYEYNLWNILARNPNAINLIRENLLINPNLLTQRGWNYLALNQNPDAINLIRENFNRLDREGWEILVKNPNAVELIRENIYKLYEYNLYNNLASNHNAIDLIIENLDKLDEEGWENLSQNPAIFELCGNPILK